MKLVFVISSLGMGGAERVLTRLANGLAGRGHRVDLLTFSRPGTAPAFPLDPAVRLRQLDIAGKSSGTPQAVRNNWRRLRILRKAFTALRPDVIVSFVDTTNVLCLIAGLGLGRPVIAAERSDPAQQEIGPIWSRLRLRTYPLAARVLLPSSGLADFFPRNIRENCRVMPNPAVIDVSGPCRLPPSSPCVVGLGRLHRQKGFDILLRAFAGVVESHPAASLWIFGEGPERANLEALRDALGLRGKARLPGAEKRPGPVLRRADVFVLSSRSEGFPNVLLEALACGAPTVCTRFSAGVGDIARDGENALLVPPGDVDALTTAIDRLLDDEALAKRLSARGPEVLDRFAPAKILDRWERLLHDTARTENAGPRAEPIQGRKGRP